MGEKTIQFPHLGMDSGDGPGGGHSPQQSIALDRVRLELEKPPLDENGLSPLPWWNYRNDMHNSVEVGHQGKTIETSTTITRDRLRTSSGRVRDCYHETTYRARTTRIYR